VAQSLKPIQNYIMKQKLVLNNKSKQIFLLISFLFLVNFRAFNFQTKKILIFSKTAGYRHSSIQDGIDAIRDLCKKNGFNIYHTEEAGFITPKNLKQFDTVIFLNTTGDIFNDQQQIYFQRYIQKGGGWVGIHSATDTEYKWPWYGQLAGAYFNGHPKIQNADLIVIDKTHPCTQGIQNNWARKDEWYNFKFINPDINILINIDESSYEGGTNGKNHPISWCHNYDGGRAFYTAMGHTKESYKEKFFLQHILAGIKWTMGL